MRRVERRLLGTGRQPLEAVVADVEEDVDADHLPRLGRAAARHAGDERVAPVASCLQQASRGVRHAASSGAGDDRRERAVDVAEDRGALRAFAQRREQALGGGRSGRAASCRSSIPDHVRAIPQSGPRLLKLALIATAAGAFSGLFGVGGGTVIVPLLVLWFGYPEHAATGTSLAAIVVIGAVCRDRPGRLRQRRPRRRASWSACPRWRGDRRHRRSSSACPGSAVSLLFAAVLVAVAIELLIR